MSSDHPRIKWRRNIAENFNRLIRVHKRYRQTTDDKRQTDGRRHIANMNMSSRSLKTETTTWRSKVVVCRVKWLCVAVYMCVCVVYLSESSLVSILMNPAQLMKTLGPMRTCDNVTSCVLFSRRLLFCFKVCNITHTHTHTRCSTENCTNIF